MEHRITITLASNMDQSAEQQVVWHFPDEHTATALFKQLLQLEPIEKQRADYKQQMDAFFRQRNDRMDQ